MHMNPDEYKSSTAKTLIAAIRDTLSGPDQRLYWLLVAPVLIVFFYQMGRGLGNTAYVLYWVTAVVLIVRQRNFEFPVVPGVLFLALLMWGTLSAALSVNSEWSYSKWAQYGLLGTSYFIGWRLVRGIPDFSLERALKLIGIVGLIAFVHYALRFIVLSMSSDFRPEAQVHGLVSAYLSPFVLYFLRQAVPGKRSFALSAAYLASLTLLLVFSNSLTEVLTFAAALGVLGFFMIPNKRQLMLGLGAVGLLLIALILLFDPAGAVLNEAQGKNGDWFSLLSQLSSYRTLLWYQALTIPPPDIWLGVGPANVGLYPPVVISESYKVGHLHNLLLDSWYEVGVVGLTIYVLFYLSQAHGAKTGVGASSAQQRGLLYATLAGIFVASMLEQSYRSVHVALFVPFLLALFSRGPTAPATADSRTAGVRALA
jgi:O-antigen ligase